MASVNNIPDEIEVSLKKEDGIVRKIGAKLAGLEDELESIRKMQDEAELKLQEAEALTNQTIQLVKEATGIFRSSKFKIEESEEFEEMAAEQTPKGTSSQHERARTAQQYKEEAENEVHAYAKVARDIHENMERLEALTTDLQNKTKKQEAEISQVAKLEKVIEEMDEHMEEMDEKVNEMIQ